MVTAKIIDLFNKNLFRHIQTRVRTGRWGKFNKNILAKDFFSTKIRQKFIDYLRLMASIAKNDLSSLRMENENFLCLLLKRD